MSTILWLRRDLRLHDNPALSAAASSGPVLPVFIWDHSCDALGAAAKWRLGLSLQNLSERLAQMGSRLILRKGPAEAALGDLIHSTGARAVYWSRFYDPDSIARDTALKATLTAQQIEARSFNSHLLFEPWSVANGQGLPYRVYTPFWKAVQHRDIAPCLPAATLTAPAKWPESLRFEALGADTAMNRGAAIMARHSDAGEQAALARLDHFVATRVAAYREDRDLPAEPATSGLSDHLAWGEISIRTCWHAGATASQTGAAGAETFLKELVWREFAYHLMYHTPHILSRNWNEKWQGFVWNTDADHPHVLAWKQGRTGVAFVDAAMREMYVTGRMHNRARMIAACYLTKHLRTDWRIGMDWFADCLSDWDPASNAMGWQWSAGCGPDAAPYFRIFNPDTQAEKFDPNATYRDRWIAERGSGHADGLSYFDAVPRRWNLSPDAPYPMPIVGLAEGRAKALTAYEDFKAAGRL